ncbi:hypothetical protein BU15DRAFT_80227 [Melanogaster broomeanus]|nr:hypothetical protein BU15DRAFT_80227 [Melanogaster broomeanus]
MSSVFTRTLTFKAHDLGDDATLMLTFDQHIQGLYHDKYPVCWKVTKFAAHGSYTARATFQSQLAFVKPQIDHESDTIIEASTYKLLNVDDKTVLCKDENDVYHFSVSAASLSLLWFTKPNSNQDPTPMLYFKGVGHGAFVRAEFTPVLRAYVNAQYQETQIIRGEVDTEAIWEQDLAELPPSTTWVLTRNKATGCYKLTEA